MPPPSDNENSIAPVRFVRTHAPFRYPPLQVPDSPITIILAGGGTGGHLYPGIGVAEALRSVLPAARPLFICPTREIDHVILTPTGFEFIPKPIVPPRFADVLKVVVTWRQTH